MSGEIFCLRREKRPGMEGKTKEEAEKNKRIAKASLKGRTACDLLKNSKSKRG
jgi:hypothetical protein